MRKPALFIAAALALSAQNAGTTVGNISESHNCMDTQYGPSCVVWIMSSNPSTVRFVVTIGERLGGMVTTLSRDMERDLGATTVQFRLLPHSAPVGPITITEITAPVSFEIEGPATR